jgi:hypothetical protein
VFNGQKRSWLSYGINLKTHHDSFSSKCSLECFTLRHEEHEVAQTTAKSELVFFVNLSALCVFAVRISVAGVEIASSFN